MADLTELYGGPFMALVASEPATSPDTVTAFLAAMEGVGVRPLEPIAHRLLSGDLIRFRAEGDRPGRPNGWARFNAFPAPHGAFGSWRLGVSKSWRGREARRLSFQDRQIVEDRLRFARIRANEERNQLQRNVATFAKCDWANAGPPDLLHGYLAAKKMIAEGLRQRGERLLVPMRDAHGRLWNLQRILPDGRKRFLKGGRVEGLFWMPVKPENMICIGEGVATMAAVRAATGYPVAAAMSAHNLPEVTQVIHAHWPDAEIIICADDDAGCSTNKGMEAALAAAMAVGARLAVPPRS